VAPQSRVCDFCIRYQSRKAAFAAAPSFPHLPMGIFVSLDSVDSSMPEVNSASAML